MEQVGTYALKIKQFEFRIQSQTAEIPVKVASSTKQQFHKYLPKDLIL